MYAQGWWTSRTIDAQFHWLVDTYQHREAVVDAPNRSTFMGGAPQRLSFLELAHAVDHMAFVFRQQGLGKGDVLCVQLPNCVEQFAIYLACARLGVVLSPVPVQYRMHEMEYLLGLSKARAVITYACAGAFDHAGMFLELQSRFAHLSTVWVVGSPVAGTLALPSASESKKPWVGAADDRLPAVDADDVFTLCWTSGTEAMPKGVPRTHNEWFSQGRLAIGLSRITHEQRLLNPFPMINMAGLSVGFFSWLMTGCTLVQHQPFKLDIFLQQLREERIDHTVAPPAILNKWLQQPDLLEGIDFRRLQRIGSGGAPLSQWMVQEFESRYGVHILNNFGSNEGAVLASAELDVPDAAVRATCFPRPAAHWQTEGLQTVTTRLVDPETECDIETPGHPGELRFAGPTVFSGYIGDPALNARAFDEQGFYRSGDLFEIAGDQAQYYRYVGRLKDIIIRGGINISGEEIDALLLAHHKVLDAAAIGYADPVMGEKICACVVLRPGVSTTLEELCAFMRDDKKVAVYKLPERLEIRTELPRNPVGKLLKRELRLELQAA